MPDVNWADHLKAEYVLRLATWSDITEQMPLLYDAAMRYDQPVIAELGTRTGNSTSALLAGAAASGGHVWSVDPGVVTVPAEWEASGSWSFLAADDTSDEAIRWLPGELDVLFIDTSHTYDHTLGELMLYAGRVRPGGIVLCHDVELKRDDYIMGTAWVESAEVSQGPMFPVAAALDHYCHVAGLTWTRQSERPAPAYGLPFYGLGTIVMPAA